jgi:hypothetical protein
LKPSTFRISRPAAGAFPIFDNEVLPGVTSVPDREWWRDNLTNFQQHAFFNDDRTAVVGHFSCRKSFFLNLGFFKRKMPKY